MRKQEAEYDRHNQACLATFTTRYATVQEYAAWLFGNFAVDSDDWEDSIPVSVVDLATLRTVEEADRAWSRVQRIVSNSASKRRLSLPAGQPEGLRAFANPSSPNMQRYWREFFPCELYPTDYNTGGAGTYTGDGGRAGGWLARLLHAALGQRGRECDQRDRAFGHGHPPRDLHPR